jgi:hypothetical protein
MVMGRVVVFGDWAEFKLEPAQVSSLDFSFSYFPFLYFQIQFEFKFNSNFVAPQL